MSVLVKDMHMPETCEDCEFHRYHSHNEYVCIATPLFYPMNLANTKGIRKDFCPLVELPDKHGDLIDRNDLKKEYAMGFDCNNCVSNWKSCQYDAIYAKMDFCLMLDDAPVVIEAECEGGTRKC